MSWWMEDHGDMEDSVDYGAKNFWTNKTKTKEKPQPPSQFLHQSKESTSLMTQWKDEDDNAEDVDNWIKKFLDLHNFLYKANLHLRPCQFLNS